MEHKEKKLKKETAHKGVSVHTFEVRIPLTEYQRGYYKLAFKKLKLDQIMKEKEDEIFDDIVRRSLATGTTKYWNYKKCYISTDLYETGISYLTFAENKLIDTRNFFSVDRYTPSDFPTTNSYIQFRVNPRKLMGYKKNNGRCILPAWDLPDVFEKLENRLEDYGFFPFDVQSAYICRIDICANITFDSDEEAERYLKLLRRGYKCRGLSEKCLIRDEVSKRLKHPKNELRYRNCGKLSYNQQELSIYLKHRQIKENLKYYDFDDEEGSEGQLRFELRLESGKVRYMKKKENANMYSDLFPNLSEYAWIKMDDYLGKLFGKGRFVSTKKAKTMILASSYKQKTKKLMIEIVDDTRRKDLIGALKGYSLSEARSMLKKFDKLGISPITVPGAWMKEYENPLYYICSQNSNHDGSFPE